MGSGFEVIFFDDPAAFLAAASDVLAADPVQATVVATIAQRMAARPGSGGAAPYAWFATVGGADGIAGVAMRTAPFAPYPLYVLSMPDGAATALADALLDRGEEVGGVNGSRPAADVLMARIAERTGGSVEVGMHTRLFELGRLVAPEPPPGRLRRVRPEEAELALAWTRQFLLDADEQGGRAPGTGHDPESFTLDDVHRKIDEGTYWFWVDHADTPFHLTGANPPAFGVARVGPVFTPREHRGRGYGGAAVAAVSALLRDLGHRVILFTDQANPVSNELYQRLGYRAVVDTIELRLSGAARTP